jgi:hypothetical protein
MTEKKEDLEKEDLEKEKKDLFKGLYIVIRPSFNGLRIMNNAGLCIVKGEVQKHPNFDIDAQVFKTFKSKDSALNYCKNVYPIDSPIKGSRITTAKSIKGLLSKPSRETLRNNAKNLGADGQVISDLPMDIAKNILKGSSEDVMEVLEDRFSKGISAKDLSILTRLELNKGNSARKDVLKKLTSLAN